MVYASHCFSIDKSLLIEAIERQDISEVVSFFDKIETITWEEAHELITDFYDHYISQFGPEILDNEEYIKNLEHCKGIYHAILEGHGIPLENSLIRYENDLSPSILLCGKKNKKKGKIEAEVPGSMILGGVEILGGSLVWILPFPGARQLGGFIIADGVRRTFNGLEDIDEENKQNNQFPSGGLPS
ncbi:MAG: hypothetical protein K940chlam6_01064 [Chlamydiae bacterium]|nr:hypothetical protein [Chlamydiota bacterium]